MTRKRVLSIGQCYADHISISRLLQREFEAEVVPAEEAAQALAESEPYDLILVNRVLDADGTSGLDVIRELKTIGTLGRVPVMLVSNHQDAQREAVELGALPGFGKSALDHPRTIERLRKTLGQ
jgi:two-component system chemotaxis response regulator CheY